MLTDNDKEFLAEHDVTELDTSKVYAWPALDFLYDGIEYTVAYDTQSGTFALISRVREITMAKFPFLYKSQLDPPKTWIYCSREPDVPSHPLSYLAAIIMCDVHKVAPTSASEAARWN